MRRQRALTALDKADRRLFRRVARSHSPLLDDLLPPLTRAANFSILWMGIATVLALVGGRFGRRAAARGMASVAVTSPLVNLVLKFVFPRARPSLRSVPVVRRLARQPASTSFPSGHAASAFAFAVGVSAEMPAVAPPLGMLATTVAYSRVYVGVHYPSDVLAGAAIGSSIALLSLSATDPRSAAPARAARSGGSCR